jgi:uncharacterized membrane protein
MFVSEPTDCENPLMWCVTHQAQFPHVALVAQQILVIVGSQIEIEQIFNLAGVITNLQWSRIGIDNLHRLIMITKN